MPESESYNWSAEKNRLLIEERRISFERIVFEICVGNKVAVLMHPNQGKYPGQMISVVKVGDYFYFVPFVETEFEIFLKTIIPSRKATRHYRSKT
jgi:hypothetical protein